MNDTPLQLALRELRGVFTRPPQLVGMGLAVVVLAISGPFDTYAAFDPAARFAYWLVMVVLSYGTGQFVSSLLLALLESRIAEKWPRVIVVALLTALPVSLVVIAVNGVGFGSLTRVDPITLWAYTTMVTLVVVVALVSITDRLKALDPAVVGTALAPPPILERVPLPQRGRLLALLVEDHYVDIVTDKGKTLVLMRLADAIREAAPVAGLQIHRSHWVARDAVVNVQRGGGKLTLELSNGLKLPVSRGYLPAAKEAGFVA